MSHVLMINQQACDIVIFKKSNLSFAGHVLLVFDMTPI